MGRLPDPHAESGERGLDPFADGVDHAGAVLVRHLRRVDRVPGALPVRVFQSVGFTPERWTRTRTSPGPGSGTGRSVRVRTSGAPVSVYSMARMPVTYPRRTGRKPGSGLDPVFRHRWVRQQA